MHRLYFKSRLVTIAAMLVLAGGLVLQAQDLAGGGKFSSDILGGAALIFRRPENPPLHAKGTGLSSAGGGRVAGRRAPQSPANAEDQMIAKGNAARSSSTPRYAEAEQQYKQATRVAPADARAFAGLGNVFLDQSRFADAVEQYSQAIKLRPDYADAKLPLGYALVRLNRYAEAITIYNQTLKLDPDDPEIHNNLGYLYNHIGSYTEAVAACQRAISLLGQTGGAYKQGYQTHTEVLSHAYKNLGNAYNGMKQYQEAIAALKQAADIEPRSAAAHFNLGLAYFNASEYVAAVEAYQRALEIRPGLPAAHFNLGLAYIALRNHTAALEQYNALMGLNRKLADQLYSMIKE